jgi:hypothetical protein
MNNSFPRLIDGMCETLRAEVLTRLDDDFARGQVFGVINLLNTFKVRADWSARFLAEQIAAQREGLEGAREAVRTVAAEQPSASAAGAPPPAAEVSEPPVATAIEDLLAARDANNHVIDAWLAWLDVARSRLPAAAIGRIEAPLRAAMRAEVDLELRYSPRPLFAEMSSGREG